MGFSTVPASMFSPDIPQTPENVRKVLDIAGWTVEEAAVEINVSYGDLLGVTNGILALTDDRWRLLLDKAGRRAFDAGCDE